MRFLLLLMIAWCVAIALLGLGTSRQAGVLSCRVLASCHDETGAFSDVALATGR